MPSHDRTLEEIKNRIDIVDFISEYVHLKKAGQNWKGLCPFHSEKTPSFTVSAAKQIFHCFGCGNGGDIFTFVMHHESLSFPEALRMLAHKAGVTLKQTPGESVKTGEKEVFIAIHKVTLSFFQHCLTKNEKASLYLQKRGIDNNARKIFSIGYAPKSWDALLTFLKKKGFREDTVLKTGLISRGRQNCYDTFRDRIVFPIYDLTGDPVAFGGRSIDGSEPKYLNSPETLIFNKRRVLYGLHTARNSIKESGFALLMEGYLDVITAHVHGFSNAVAPLGTALTQEQGRLIKRFTDEAVLVFDSDQAGIKAAKSATNILLENDINVKIISMPLNEDPDSYLRKKGKTAFQNLIDSPLSFISFYLHQKGDRHLIAREVLETISRISNKVLQGEQIRTLSEKLGIEERFIIEEFQKAKRNVQGSAHKTDQSYLKKSHQRPLEEVYLIQLLLQLPDRMDDVSKNISLQDFKDPGAKGIFEKIKNGFGDLDTLIVQCSTHEKELLTEISLKEEFTNPGKVLNDLINFFKENKRKLLLRDLQSKIKEAESKKDFVLLKKLQKEQYDLKKSRTL